MSIEAKLVTIISGLLLVANGLYSSDANNRPAFTRNPFTIACNLHGGTSMERQPKLSGSRIVHPDGGLRLRKPLTEQLGQIHHLMLRKNVRPSSNLDFLQMRNIRLESLPASSQLHFRSLSSGAHEMGVWSSILQAIDTIARLGQQKQRLNKRRFEAIKSVCLFSIYECFFRKNLTKNFHGKKYLEGHGIAGIQVPLCISPIALKKAAGCFAWHVRVSLALRLWFNEKDGDGQLRDRNVLERAAEIAPVLTATATRKSIANRHAMTYYRRLRKRLRGRLDKNPLPILPDNSREYANTSSTSPFERKNKLSPVDHDFLETLANVQHGPVVREWMHNRLIGGI